MPALQIKKDSIWGDVNSMNDSVKVEYNILQELFSQRVIKEVTKPGDLVVKIQAAPSEITLLDPKRSMNINIYLKQFRKNNAAIVDLIRKGEARTIGVEKLKGLIKILPPVDEIELITSYDGDLEKLGNAEKFFLQLTRVPFYQLRLELMLLKADFQSQLSNVRTNLVLITSVCRGLHDNKSLKKFLRFVLHAGNFINKGSSAGDAVGFRISSLNKLILTKSNDPKISLLHVLVEETEKKDKDVLKFVDDLQDDLHKVSRFSLEQVKGEFKTLKTTVKKLKTQVENSSDEEIKQQFGDFLEEADGDLSDVDETLDRLGNQRSRLAQHYCENENSFNLEEFLAAFMEFCDKVKACQQELETKRQAAEKAELRKRAHEELMEKRKSGRPGAKDAVIGAGIKRPPGVSGPGEVKIVDNLVSEIRRGNVLRRLSNRMKNKPSSPKTFVSDVAR